MSEPDDLPPFLPSPPPVPPPLLRPEPRSRRVWLWLLLLPVVLALVAAAFVGPSLFASWRTQRLAERLTALSDAKKWQEGLDLANRELPGVAADARVYFALENLHYGANHLEETKHYAAKTLALDPANEMAARLVISICRDFDDDTAAYEAGKAWIARNTGGAEIYKDLAMAADDAGHDDECLAFAEQAYRRKPANPRVAGVYFYYLLRDQDAGVVLPQVLRWASDNRPDAFFWAQVGKGLSEAEEHALGLIHLRCALAMGSNDEGVATEMLDCYRGLSDAAAAKAFVEEYQQTHRLNGAIWRTLGAIQYDADDLRNALDSFRMAQRLEPDNATTMANLLFTLVALERAPDAINEGENWLSAGRRKPTALLHRALGNAHFTCSRWAEAERHYRESLERDPVLVSSARDLVSTLGKLGRTAEAVAFGTEWQQRHPGTQDESFMKALDAARRLTTGEAPPAG